MLDHHTPALFALAALGLVLTPGPNMLYLLSRTICQGRRAGLVSLAGVVLGFTIHILAASLGLSALLLAMPVAYDALRWVGAAYLLYVAWSAVRAGTDSVPIAGLIRTDPPMRLFRIGLFTSVLNPKVGMFYIALLPQFIDLTRGSPFFQSVELGAIQITISSAVLLIIVLTAGMMSAWLSLRPRWIRAQRWFLAAVLTGLAMRLAIEESR
jgi:threonine/homoserine/homoserine lactone efflux protein